MQSSQRPLSPHLQVYRLPLTAVMSITHRATGAFLVLGALVLALWMLALASGEPAYERMHGVITSLPGQVLLFAWTFSLFYHLCNGVRHLLWDFGYGFELKEADLSGYIVIATAVLLTLVVWLLALIG